MTNFNLFFLPNPLQLHLKQLTHGQYPYQSKLMLKKESLNWDTEISKMYGKQGNVSGLKQPTPIPASTVTDKDPEICEAFETKQQDIHLCLLPVCCLSVPYI